MLRQADDVANVWKNCLYDWGCQQLPGRILSWLWDISRNWTVTCYDNADTGKTTKMALRIMSNEHDTCLSESKVVASKLTSLSSCCLSRCIFGTPIYLALHPNTKSGDPDIKKAPVAPRHRKIAGHFPKHGGNVDFSGCFPKHGCCILKCVSFQNFHPWVVSCVQFLLYLVTWQNLTLGPAQTFAGTVPDTGDTTKQSS